MPTKSDFFHGLLKMIDAVQACSSKGQPLVGTTYSGTLGDSGSCSTFDATYGTNYYSDFYVVSLTGGRTYRGVFSTTQFGGIDYFQDYNSGTVLARSSDLSSNGSVTYTPPSSGNYYFGVGSYGTGNYTFSVSDITQVTCNSDASHLCLGGSPQRFRVSINFVANGQPGVATGVPLTTDMGYFYFFTSTNVEVVVKVVDGRTVNDKWWVFIGGLTDVNTTLTVTDTVTGALRVYTNPQGTAFRPVQDTSAF